MSLDNKLIASVLKDREVYNKIDSLVLSPEELFSDINIILYKKVREYYEADKEATHVDMELLSAYIERVYPKQASTINTALRLLDSLDVVSPKNIMREFVEIKRQAIAQQLAGKLLGSSSHSEVSDLIESYLSFVRGEEEDTGGDIEIYEAPLLDSIAEAINTDNLIKIYPLSLNEKLGGGLLRGHHILVFARPETGKTLFVINMVRGFLEQGLKVLYINNEEPPSDLLGRIFCSILDIDRYQLRESNPNDIDEKLKDKGINNLTFVRLEPGTISQIRGLCGRVKPDVVVVDQLRNLNINGSDGLTTSQEKAAKEMRVVGQSFNCLAVSVAQAGESASNKLVLGMSDVDSSKTGMPAAVDVMVGIGLDDIYEDRGKRMVSLPRNKPGNDHSFFSITVDTATTRVVEK